MANEPPPLPPLIDLTAATTEEVVEALSYALRFDERGKPGKVGGISRPVLPPRG